MEKFELIRQWAEARGLYEKGNPITQCVKLQEEVGELARALLKKDEPEIIDAIGDIVVVLTNLAYQKGYLIENCIDSAYNEIKNRKGKMQNGTFVKQQNVFKNKNVIKLKKHRNGYYNMPVKFSEINEFIKNNIIEINGKTYDDNSKIHLACKPSKNGGVAYVYEKDLK